MAVDYTSLFEDIGSLTRALNVFRGLALGSGTIDTRRSNIQTVLQSNGSVDDLDGVQESFDRMRDSAVGWAQEMGGRISARLRRRASILEELPGITSASPSIFDVLIELHRDMALNSESIDASAVTLGTVNADAGNSGDGTVLLDKVLDRITPPLIGAPVVPQYKDLDSELATTETMTLTCVSDEDADGFPEGEEVFRWEGTPGAGTLGWRTEGSGHNSNVPTLNSHNLVSNKDFESWSANVPESWDLDSGLAGTHVIQETTAADVFRGDSALRLAGDGSQATIQISQTLPARLLTPGRRYCLACQVKGQSGILAGALTIEFESPGGGYTAASSEKISMNAAALAAQTSYGIEYFYLTAPDTIPDDLELVIKITGTLTNAKAVRVDSLAFGPVSWGNGVNLVVVAGASQFTRADRFTFDITNNGAGTFQEMFRRLYRIQMPSDTGGLETQADSLAE